MDKQKYEREIEEILAKYEKETGHKNKADGQVGNIRPSPGAPVRSAPRIPSTWNWKRMGSGQYIAAAFAVALLALLVSGVSHLLASILVIVSVILFIVPV